MPIAYLDHSGWTCCCCDPPTWQGRLQDVMNHLVNDHGIKRWTVDSGHGYVFEGLTEMAVTT